MTNTKLHVRILLRQAGEITCQNDGITIVRSWASGGFWRLRTNQPGHTRFTRKPHNTRPSWNWRHRMDWLWSSLRIKFFSVLKKLDCNTSKPYKQLRGISWHNKKPLVIRLSWARSIWPHGIKNSDLWTGIAIVSAFANTSSSSFDLFVIEVTWL